MMSQYSYSYHILDISNKLKPAGSERNILIARDQFQVTQISPGHAIELNPARSEIFTIQPVPCTFKLTNLSLNT